MAWSWTGKESRARSCGRVKASRSARPPSWWTTDPLTFFRTARSGPRFRLGPENRLTLHGSGENQGALVRPRKAQARAELLGNEIDAPLLYFQATHLFLPQELLECLIVVWQFAQQTIGLEQGITHGFVPRKVGDARIDLPQAEP